LFAGLPTITFAESKDAAEQAIAAAEAARKKAASVGGEWRDTGKMIKEAQAAAEAGKFEEAVKLASKAERQGELGYEQAMHEKDAGFPDWMK
jgi:membrane protein involved in colicin uptake